MENFPDGIIQVGDYYENLQSLTFRTMESYSDQFLQYNQASLKSYAQQWVADPLHQWSRQYEYPYVLDKIKMTATQNKLPTILDAGSGVTFLPWYIKEQWPDSSVVCCDSDITLLDTFNVINTRMSKQVDFYVEDLHRMSFADHSFDLIYCVSVLEHTERYSDIIAEFSRILRPRGRLVITFDLSLDGTQDISLDGGRALLDALGEYFEGLENAATLIRTQALHSSAFTTTAAARMNSDLLPWVKPTFIERLKARVTGRGMGGWPPILTVFCTTLTKCNPESRGKLNENE
jgi:SAM-dependent methyltransferase